jgi:anti-sigma regulatory factor (Ser/Thr protein kinase)
VSPFQHPALLYRDDFLTGTAAFVHDALEAGEPVLVAVPAARLDRLRAALGAAAARVTFVDMTVAGRNPGRIIPGVLLRFADTHPGRRVAMVSESIWPGRTALEYPACAAHEALTNAVFKGRDAAILCAYDARALDARTIADAGRTHPHLIECGVQRASDRYADPLVTAASFDLPLPLPPPAAAVLAFRSGGDLPGVRAFLRAGAVARLPADRADDLLVAVNELATNAVQYAGGGRLTVWTEPGLVVCQVDDGGRLTDPLVGLVTPAPESTQGRGLILAHQLCDLLRLHTARSGTSIRLQMALPA